MDLEIKVNKALVLRKLRRFSLTDLSLKCFFKMGKIFSQAHPVHPWRKFNILNRE
jgi:hypothetical protein